jgi:RNA polymerase sigma factor (TIGR02999 family)
MADKPVQEITEMLRAWSGGDREVLEKVIPVVYDELHRLAARHMARERPGHILQTSALVNEAYLRLSEQKNVYWQNRSQFFAIAARMMRRILVDKARKQKFAKRGGGALQVSLTEAAAKADEPSADVLALNEALIALEELDLQQSRVVELRFFGGLTIPETAEALNISVDMVKREWSTAKAWLYREITM